MTVGYTAQTDAQAVNTKIAQLTIELRQALEEIKKFKAFIDMRFPNDTAGNNALKAFMTYDDADVTLFRSTITDLDNLRLTAVGQRTQPANSNFFFNADKVVGFR